MWQAQGNIEHISLRNQPMSPEAFALAIFVLSLSGLPYFVARLKIDFAADILQKLP